MERSRLFSGRDAIAGSGEECRDDDAEADPEPCCVSLELLQQGCWQLESNVGPWHKNGTSAAVRLSSPTFGKWR